MTDRQDHVKEVNIEGTVRTSRTLYIWILTVNRPDLIPIQVQHSICYKRLTVLDIVVVMRQIRALLRGIANPGARMTVHGSESPAE